MHRCSHGYTTEGARRDWLAAHGQKDTTASRSLVADSDPEVPLYPWQLYSLLGPDKIRAIVVAFYQRVYADTEAPWFRDAFTRISGIDHHVDTQAAFWADAFGGGRQYHGGEYRLQFHHTNNAAQVMTAAGAARWMHHMAGTLNEDVDFSVEDPRVKPCIVAFLRLRMQKYASTHGWRFDECDFDALEAEAAMFTAAELQAMPASQLRRVAVQRGVRLTGLVERADYVRELACPPAVLRGLAVRQLRRLLRLRGVRTEGLVEKEDFVALLLGENHDAAAAGPGGEAGQPDAAEEAS